MMKFETPEMELLLELLDDVRLLNSSPNGDGDDVDIFGDEV